MMQPPIKLLPMRLIDPPSNASRIDIDDAALGELAASIAEMGLLQPICVLQAHGRYEIACGHRRFLACRNLGRAEIEARDYTDTGLDADDIQIHENAQRFEISDAEWCEKLRWMREERGYDLARMLKATGKTEGWIAARLNMRNGDPALYEALRKGELSLSQCVELNKFPDACRAMYIEQAKQSTPPVAVLKDWLKQYKLLNLPQTLPADSAPIVQVTDLPGVAAQEPCILCQERHSPFAMKYVLIHAGCLKTLLDAIQKVG